MRRAKKILAFLFALPFLLACLLRADEIFALGYSVNNGPRLLLKISPATGEILAQVPTPFRPVPLGSDAAELGMSYGDGSLWLLQDSVNNAARSLHRLDPATGKMTSIPTDLRPVLLAPDFFKRTLAFGGGSIWGLGESINNGSRPLYKLDPASGKILQTIPSDIKPLGYGADLIDLGLAYGQGFLWGLSHSTNNNPRALFKIDPATGRIVKTFPSAFRVSPAQDAARLGFTFGAGHLWALGPSINNGPRRLHKIDPTTGANVQTITTQLRPPGFGVDVIPVGIAYRETP